MKAYHSFLAVLRKGKNGVCVFVIEIIEEDATTSSPLIPVLDQEVVITPLLELGEVFRIMLVTHSLQHSKDGSHDAKLLTTANVFKSLQLTWL